MNLVSDINLKCKHWLNLHVENEVQMWFEIKSTIQIGLKLRRRFKLNLARMGHHAAQRNAVLTKKIFHIEVNVAHQNHASHKKICCGRKKYVTP